MAQLVDRFLGRHRRAVAALAGHRVVRRADREDARCERDLCADQPRGVAGAVHALVVIQDRVRDLPVTVEGAHQHRTVLRMALYDFLVRRGDGSRVQNPVRPRELADLVQKRGGAHDLLLLAGAADLLGQALRVARDGRGMVARARVAHLERPHERAQHAELQPDELDRTRLPVERVEVSADGRTVELTTGPLVKDRVYAITSRGIRSAKGEALVHPTERTVLEPGGESSVLR